MAKVFISYSHCNEIWKDRVGVQCGVLARQGLLDVWDDRRIDAGDDWYPEISSALDDASVALLLITAEFLNSSFILNEEVPSLLERRQQVGVRVIPVICEPCAWQEVEWLAKLQGRPKDNKPLLSMAEYEWKQCLADLAREVKALAEKPVQPKTDQSTSKLGKFVPIDRLPTVAGEFFGREEELKLLNDAWLSKATNIVQFIAPGGTGKTKLLRYWLDQTRPEKLIAWSFYSQGASEEKQPSATLFYNRVFELLDPSKTITDFANRPEKMGEYLADLLRQNNCLLILDGFEPLQHSSAVLRGELKDRALRALLKSLAAHHSSLCIITTRIPIHELSGHSPPVVISNDLQNLDEDDGVDLLKSLQVSGSDVALRSAVNEYGRHALALHLLGNALTTYLDGDVLKRDTLDDLLGEEAYTEVEQHAFKVMQAYKKWLKGRPELRVLYLLGLFDHPIELEVLEVLWKAKIPKLTDKIPSKAWKVAIKDLRGKHRLLSMHEGRSDLLDCHPLIREYFGAQLKNEQPESWKQAHKKLYGYYKALPKKMYPDTLEEMRPLFHAVTHGCAAGLHKRVVTEIYYTRIGRKKENYSIKKLGAYSDELAAIACFFDEVWLVPSAKISSDWQLSMLGNAGFCLRALGRLHEALEPMEANVGLSIKLKKWDAATTGANNQSELFFTLGALDNALNSGKHSVIYADKSTVKFKQVAMRTTQADVFHNVGNIEKAMALFGIAERLQREFIPSCSCLVSLWGFRYRDLLMTLGRIDEAIHQTSQAIIVAHDNGDLLSIALDQLSFGRAHHAQGGLSQARNWLDQAVAGLHQAGTQQYVPLGYLARAALWRDLQEWDKAHRDLAEVWAIAEPSGMRLHLTDYHLEMARLLLAENPPCSPFCKGGDTPDSTGSDRRALPFEKGETEGISYHIAEAERLITETGYHRRDQELADLQAQISGGQAS